MIGATVGLVRALGMLVWQGRRRARRARPGPTATRLVRAVVRPDACTYSIPTGPSAQPQIPQSWVRLLPSGNFPEIL